MPGSGSHRGRRAELFNRAEGRVEYTVQVDLDGESVASQVAESQCSEADRGFDCGKLPLSVGERVKLATQFGGPRLLNPAMVLTAALCLTNIAHRTRSARLSGIIPPDFTARLIERPGKGN